MKYENRQLAETLARQAVAEAAPEELPMFSVTAAAYFDNPERALAASKSPGKDEMLGFGLEAAAPVITTVALWIAQEVLRLVNTQLQENVKAESAGAIRAFIQRLLQRFRRSDRAAPRTVRIGDLSQEQLARIREQALRRARDQKVPEGKAVAIADGIIAALVLPATGA
jgi:hypothetical protein